MRCFSKGLLRWLPGKHAKLFSPSYPPRRGNAFSSAAMADQGLSCYRWPFQGLGALHSTAQVYPRIHTCLDSRSSSICSMWIPCNPAMTGQTHHRAARVAISYLASKYKHCFSDIWTLSRGLTNRMDQSAVTRQDLKRSCAATSQRVHRTVNIAELNSGEVVN